MNKSNEYICTFDYLVKAYLTDCEYNDVSEKTLKNYRSRIGYFRDFWAETDPQSVPTVADVRAWKESMLNAGKAKSTVRQYLTELNGFFEYATDPDIAGDRAYKMNPVKKKLYPRKTNDEKKPYSKVLNADDLKALWANQKYRGAGQTWARNYAIITLLLDGKIRNSELLDLKLSDVHFATDDEPYSYIVIERGKGDKYREVDLNDISVTALRLYLESGIRPGSISDDDYLFGTTAAHEFGVFHEKADWHRGTSNWLSQLVERHVERVTGKKGFRTHSLRHTGSIMELNNGASLEALQAELGHSSVQTTEIYAGRLQSKRNRMNMKEVYEARDKWAEINSQMLANA